MAFVVGSFLPAAMMMVEEAVAIKGSRDMVQKYEDVVAQVDQ